MRIKFLTPLACLLSSALVVFPACGGDEASETSPASESVPRQEVQGVERRVSDLEKEIIKLRRDLEGARNEQSSADKAGSDQAGADTAPAEAPGTGTADANTAGGAESSAGSSGGAGSGSGSGSGPGSGGASRTGPTEEGGGPDPGTTEDDPGIRDICGENPAPTC